MLAPFDGVITARNTDVGYLINAGQAPGNGTVPVGRHPRLRIYAQVPEAYAAATATGLKAELHFAERPGVSLCRGHHPHVECARPDAREHCRWNCSSTTARRSSSPGSYTEIHFKLPASTQTLRLPANTVLFRGKDPQVAIVDSDHTIKLKNIEQGRDFGKTIEVLTDSTRTIAVVVNPPDSIEDGMQVRMVAAPGQTQAARLMSTPRCASRSLRAPRRRAAPSHRPTRCRDPRRAAPEQYKEQPGDWKVAQPQDSQPRGAWWTMYNDPELNALEEQDSRFQSDAEGRLCAARSRPARNTASPAPIYSRR